MKVIRTQEGSELWKAQGAISGAPLCMQVEVKYLVIDATDKGSALAAVWEEAPDYIDNARTVKKEMRVDGYDDDRSLSISVVYQRGDIGFGNDDNATEKATVSFECSAGTTHIDQAYRQRRVFGDDDADCLIGYQPTTGAIEGVDIVIPVMRETHTKKMSLRKLNSSYKRTIAELTGRVNESEFKGWQRGEMLFLGASFSATEDDSIVMVTYQFAIAPNETRNMFGVSVSKLGHEYTWAMFKKKSVPPKPSSIYVSQVYQFGNFGKLGL